MKMLITLEPHWYILINFFIPIHFILSRHWGMQKGDEALLSIIPAGRGQLVKMLIALKPHGIF